MIKTNQLHLFPYERIHLEALHRDKHELAALLQMTVPDSWPRFPEAYAILIYEMHQANPAGSTWPGLFFLHPQEKVLVGSGGFYSHPDASGMVEIGYEIAAEYWNRGFATEAAQGMVDYAFTHPQVQAVIAHTLAEINASNKVLQKCGMRFVAEEPDPEEGAIWCWQITRDEYDLGLSLVE